MAGSPKVASRYTSSYFTLCCYLLFHATEISDAFKMFDKNGDGQISVEELGEAMKQAGQEMTNDELKDMIKAVDRNGMTTMQKSLIIHKSYD